MRLSYALCALVVLIIAALLALNIGPCFYQTAMFWVFILATPFIITAVARILQRAKPEASAARNLCYSALGLLMLQGGWLILNLFSLHLYSGMCATG